MHRLYWAEYALKPTTQDKPQAKKKQNMTTKLYYRTLVVNFVIVSVHMRVHLDLYVCIELITKQQHLMHIHAHRYGKVLADDNEERLITAVYAQYSIRLQAKQRYIGIGKLCLTNLLSVFSIFVK